MFWLLVDAFFGVDAVFVMAIDVLCGCEFCLLIEADVGVAVAAVVTPG